MDTLWGRSLRQPVLVAFVLIMALVGGAIFVIMQNAQRQLIEHDAVKIADVVARLALASRSAYSSAVADKLRDDGTGPHGDYEKRRGFVPLPAQFLKLVGYEAADGSDGLYRYRPLSKWNLEPKQGLHDDFQRWAWRQLEQQDRAAPGGAIDWQPAWRFEKVNDVRTLRFMRADPASSQACVNCHNEIEAEPATRMRRVTAGVEPGRQWRQHQLLGAIEVQIPVDKVEALAARQQRQTIALVVLMAAVGLAAAAWFALQDIRRERALAVAFEQRAKFDGLTGVANRELFAERVAESIARGARDGTAFAVLFVDMDHFKRVNDSLGHAAGDRVLAEVARRLSASVREVDTVARQSGDEFTVLLHATAGREDLARVASKLIHALNAPYREDALAVSLSASIGISKYPEDGGTAEELVKSADTAMYRAKQQGRNSYQFFADCARAVPA